MRVVRTCIHKWLNTQTHRHTQGTIPLWPQWLITFNKANRVLLVRINLFPILVRAPVTSNCQTLCSMKWGLLSPRPGPLRLLSLSLSSHGSTVLSPLPFFFPCITNSFPRNTTLSLEAIVLMNIFVKWLIIPSHSNSFLRAATCAKHIQKSCIMPPATHAY